MKRRMPEPVQQLRHPWPSLCGKIRGLTEELEQEFRFGQRVTKTEDGYLTGGTLQGGSSSMWYPASREDYHAYKRWQNAEGVQEARDDEALADLTTLLSRHRIRLDTCRKTGGRRGRVDPQPFSGYGPVYRDMRGILAALPEEHLDRPALGRIRVGGWGPDAAKASAYEDGAVLVYDFACRGARRTFLGLFLHELGHAHEVSLPEPTKDAIYRQYQVLLETDAFIGVEFLVDADTRRLYQRLVFNEFLAESYMIYAACGEGLRQAIAACEPPAQEAWQELYAILRETFCGVEYE